MRSKTRWFGQSSVFGMLAGVCFAAAASGVLAVSQPLMQTPKVNPPAKRQILAIGGGGLERADGTPLLMEYFLALAGKKSPRVCFLPSASGDAISEINRWNQATKGLDCESRVQKIYIESRKVKSFEDELLKADAIYVGGGNAINMLAMWQAQGIDKILRQAYERGIVLAGEGAGAICWFEQGVTDSRPGKLTVMNGLGYLKGSLCPAFNTEKKYHALFQDWIKMGAIKEGLGAGQGVGLHFVDEQLFKAVGLNASAQAYRIRRDGGNLTQTAIALELLAK